MLGSAALAACGAPQLKAPTDKGVCYHVCELAIVAPRFYVVARDQPHIVFCAARLEEMRLKFLSLGGSNNEMVGAYQGQFIFIDRAGVYFGRSLEGTRFFALARTGDGRLAVPGAIQREAPAEAPPAAPAQ